MSGRASWTKWFHRDFVHGTRGMPEAEVGRYVRLLCAMFDSDDGTISGDVEHLHLILECRRSDVAAKLEPLIARNKIFRTADGRLHNGRVDADIVRQAQVDAKLGRTSRQVPQQMPLKLEAQKANSAAKSDGERPTHVHARTRQNQKQNTVERIAPNKGALSSTSPKQDESVPSPREDLGYQSPAQPAGSARVGGTRLPAAPARPSVPAVPPAPGQTAFLKRWQASEAGDSGALTRGLNSAPLQPAARPEAAQSMWDRINQRFVPALPPSGTTGPEAREEPPDDDRSSS